MNKSKSIYNPMKPCILCNKNTVNVSYLFDQNTFYFDNKKDLNDIFSFLILSPLLDYENDHKTDGVHFNCLDCYLLLTRIKSTFGQFKILETELDQLKGVVAIYQNNKNKDNHHHQQVNLKNLKTEEKIEIDKSDRHEITNHDQTVATADTRANSNADEDTHEEDDDDEKECNIKIIKEAFIENEDDFIDQDEEIEETSSTDDDLKPSYTEKEWNDSTFSKRNIYVKLDRTSPGINENGNNKESKECKTEMNQSKNQETKCKYCKKTFSPLYLKTHIMGHTNQRPFKCDQRGCTKKFKTQSMLTIHKTLHQKPDANTELRCKICPNKIFGHRHYLRLHNWSVHKNNQQ